jgi:hypothetical protein
MFWSFEDTVHWSGTIELNYRFPLPDSSSKLVSCWRSSDAPFHIPVTLASTWKIRFHFPNSKIG